jgi:hypothetical protein
VLGRERIGRSTSIDLVRKGKRLALTVKPWRLEG